MSDDGAAPDVSDGAAPDVSDGAAIDGASANTRGPYVESPIIMTTVRFAAPFVFTFGLFVMFHGADSSGGGFQGGVIVGTVVLMLAIAFGIETTRDWMGSTVPVVLVGLGVATFIAIGLGAVLFGGAFLEYAVYGFDEADKYGIELVELAIGLIVSGVVAGLLFVIAAGDSVVSGEMPRGNDGATADESDADGGGS